MRILIDFEFGGKVFEAFHLRSFRIDAEPSDRLENLNRDIMLKAEEHMPKEASSELRKILVNLTQEAARIGCLAGFEYCAGVVTEKAEQMHKRGNFSDRKNTFVDSGDDSFRNGRRSNGGRYDRRPGNGNN